MKSNGAITQMISVMIMSAAISVASSLPGEKSVQAFSEGSDCRCKCILSSEEGGPCDDSIVGGARRTIYTVETISGGTDCRCSCNAPPPGICETTSKDKKRRSHEPSHKTEQELATEIDAHRIDLVELHSSISNMVAAMVKLEKAVAKKSSNEQLNVIRENVQRVVSNLESTNGSYQDLLSDLNLGSSQWKTDDQAVADDKEEPSLLISPSIQNTTSYSQPEITRAHGTTLGRFQDTIEPKLADHHVVDVTTTQQQTTVPAISTPENDQFDVLMTPRNHETTQHVDLTERTTTIAPQSTSQQAKNKTYNKTDNEFDIAEVKGAKVTTIDLEDIQVVAPKVIFVPHRSVPEEESDSKNARRQSKPKNTVDEYQYDYESYFDVEKEETDRATEEPAPDDAEEKQVDTARETKTTSSTVTFTSTSATPQSINTTTNISTITTTHHDNSYADHLDQYEEEDDYDAYYSEDYYGDLPTGKKTRAVQTTTQQTTTSGLDSCGTLLKLSRPILVSHFGRREGSWMRDPIPSKMDPHHHTRIYLANFYYGSNLIEFDNEEGLRTLKWRNSYHLPHKWIGTGHIVYNGSFYYNRAFSRSLIKYNLQYRFVSAWTHLTNAIYDPTTPFTWRGHSMVHMVADEEGLWVIFPSRDPFNPDARLTYVINKINPIDLRTEKSFKSKIRNSVSHVFMICGIVYSTDRYNSRHGRVTHAFDTRTMVQRSFHLGFENMFSYSVQLLYNPKERKIYGWDNGRQVEYTVTMIY